MTLKNGGVHKYAISRQVNRSASGVYDLSTLISEVKLTGIAEFFVGNVITTPSVKQMNYSGTGAMRVKTEVEY